MQTGTMGAGWVVFAPGVGLSNGGVCVISTTADWTGTSSNTPWSGDANLQSFFTNSPWSSSAVTDSMISARIVSAGLRVRNITPVMNRGCILVGMEEEGHSQLMSGTTRTSAAVPALSSWLQEETAERINSDSGDWCSVVFHPVNQGDLNFASLDQMDNSNETLWMPGNSYLGFYAQASNTSQNQVFDVEAIVTVEVTGQSAQGLTPSESDPQGLAIVQNITSTIDVRKPRVGDRLPILKRILNGAKTFAGFAADFAPIAMQLISLL